LPPLNRWSRGCRSVLLACTQRQCGAVIGGCSLTPPPKRWLSEGRSMPRSNDWWRSGADDRCPFSLKRSSSDSWLTLLSCDCFSMSTAEPDWPSPEDDVLRRSPGVLRRSPAVTMFSGCFPAFSGCSLADGDVLRRSPDVLRVFSGVLRLTAVFSGVLRMFSDVLRLTAVFSGVLRMFSGVLRLTAVFPCVLRMFSGVLRMFCGRRRCSPAFSGWRRCCLTSVATVDEQQTDWRRTDCLTSLHVRPCSMAGETTCPVADHDWRRLSDVCRVYSGPKPSQQHCKN